MGIGLISWSSGWKPNRSVINDLDPLRHNPLMDDATYSKNHSTALLFVGSAALLWSSGGLFIKLLALNGFQVAAYRSLIAAFTMFLILKIRKIPFSIKLDGTNLSCALTYAGVLILFVLSTKLTKAANAIFLQFSAPIYLLFLEPIFLKSPFQRKDLVAILACLLGMSLFFAGKLDAGDALGNALAMGSGLCLAIFSLLLKRKSLLRPNESPAGAIVLGNALVFLLCLPMLSSGPAPRMVDFAMLLYLGVFQIGIAYLLFTRGMRHVSATGAMITSMLEAVFNPVWVFLGMGERPSPYALLGAGVMLCVIALYHLNFAAFLSRAAAWKTWLRNP